MSDRVRVRAAGALVRRRVAGELQVLLVHSALHGDWGWPKGKPDPDEPLPSAAVREVGEETGVQVRLGVRLPGTSYVLPDGRPKTVRYWAADVRQGEAGTPSPEEIDDVAWLPVEAARERLTRIQDQVPLNAMLAREAGGRLETWPLLVLRHGNAVKRSRWDGSEATRPLTPVGRVQAQALAAVLPSWAPRLILTSPWERCLATVQPLARSVPLPLHQDPRLDEEGPVRETLGAEAWLDGVLSAAVPTVVCTHRPVLPALFDAVLARTDAATAPDVPRRKPLLEKGEFAVLHVRTDGAADPIVGLERLRAQDR